MKGLPGRSVSSSLPGALAPSPEAGPYGSGDRPTRPHPLRVLDFELSLATAPLSVLESAVRTISKESASRCLEAVEGTEEVAILVTCHRVEVTVLTASLVDFELWKEVLPGPPGAWRIWRGREAVHHLFRVAAGLESLAVGEVEVRDQVRAASAAVASRHPRPILRELLREAVAAAEDQSGRAPSIGALAAHRLLSVLVEARPAIAVLGAGQVGRQVVEALAGQADVTVIFHRKPPDAEFLERTQARAVPVANLTEALSGTHALVAAAKLGDQPVAADRLPTGRPFVVVDLGMPRNLASPPLPQSQLRVINLEELHALHRPGTSDASRDASLRQRSDEYAERLERHLMEPWVAAVRRSAEAMRREELTSALPFLGDLSPEQAIAVERLTRKLVDRLLLPPTERLRDLPAGPAGELTRRAALSLFEPLAPDS